MAHGSSEYASFQGKSTSLSGINNMACCSGEDSTSYHRHPFAPALMAALQPFTLESLSCLACRSERENVSCPRPPFSQTLMAALKQIMSGVALFQACCFSKDQNQLPRASCQGACAGPFSGSKNMLGKSPSSDCYDNRPAWLLTMGSASPVLGE